MDSLSASMVLPQERSSELELLASNPINPGRLMIYFWAFIFFVYCFGPIYLTPAMSLTTFLFLVTHIGLFVYGVSLATQSNMVKAVRSISPLARYFQEKTLPAMVLLLLCIGLVGGLLSIYCKLAAVDVINFASLSKLRAERASSLMHGMAAYNGILSALAFLTYPAGLIGMVAVLINYETHGWQTKLLAYLCMAVLVLSAVCAGGRSAILVLFILAGSAFYIRKQLGKHCIPQSALIRVAFIALLIVFTTYSSYVWTVRSQQAKMSTQTMLHHAERVWGAHPRESLRAVSDALDNPQLMQSVLSSIFYFIQSISTTEHLLFANHDRPKMYGAYQVDLVAALVRVIPGGADFLRSGYDTLAKSHVYGYFTGAWAGLFIDFGTASFLIALLWGFLAGKSLVNFKQNPGVLTGVLYLFWIYSIFISFVSAPFGFANSFMIFFWFVVLSLGTTLVARLQLASYYEKNGCTCTA